MTLKPALFLFLSLTLIACAKNRSIPLNIQCNQDIKSANEHLKTRSGELDKVAQNTTENLIQAAKIQQQHAKYPDCIDKAQRALTLLKAGQQTEKTK